MTGPKLKIRANTAAKTSRRETSSSLPPGLPPTEIWLLSFSVSQQRCTTEHFEDAGGEGAKRGCQAAFHFHNQADEGTGTLRRHTRRKDKRNYSRNTRT